MDAGQQPRSPPQLPPVANPHARSRTAARPLPRSGGLTLGKLVLGAIALLLLAYFVGKRNVRDSAPDQVTQNAAPAASPATQAPSRHEATILQGEKSTTLSEVDDARMQVLEQGTVLRIDGGVGRRFVTDLQAQLDANPGLQRIDISSGGGYANPGLEAARMIRRRNLIVRVHSHCASMCVALWAAAAQRQLQVDAVIGLHAWNAQCEAMPSPQREECRYQFQFATAHDASYGAWLRDAGFSQRLLDLQTSTASENIALLTAPQLWANGVDFSVVDGNGVRMPRAEVERLFSERAQRR